MECPRTLSFNALVLVSTCLLLLVSCSDSGPEAAPPTGTKPTNSSVASSIPRAVDEAALREAAVTGDVGTLRKLIDKGVNINAADNEGRTALTEAAFYGRTEAAKFLIEHDADVFAKKKDGETALTMAAGHKDIAEMIDREIRLIEVAGKGDNKALQEFLDKDAYVNVRDPAGRTPLIEATWYNHPETVKLLLAKGANPNAKKSDGVSPLAIAKGKGYHEIAEMLKTAGAK